MAKNDSFVDRVVWITGASAGLGLEMAREFAARGAHVAVSARRGQRLSALAAELEHNGRRALAVPCDVTDEPALREAVARVVDHFGRLDVAVANAGFAVRGSIEELSAEDWRRQLETNVVGAAITARHALPHLRQCRGRLALVGSAAGFLCASSGAAYTSSKYAVRALGQCLSIQLHGSGVSCTTLHPGFVTSEIGQVDNQGRFDSGSQDCRPARLMWPTDRAARVMVDAIWRRKRELVFTAHGRFGAFVGMHLPSVVHFAMTRVVRLAP